MAPDGGLRGLARATRRTDVRAGMWLVTLPAIAFGTIGVVGSLRLDTLGATGTAIAASFFVAAAIESATAPIAGRLSDRFGRIAPVRAGLLSAAVLGALIGLPTAPWVFAGVLVLLTASVAFPFAPAMTAVADAAESAGLRQGSAFGLVNLAWAAGQTAGSAGSGALADVAGDAVPFAVAAALCAATLLGLSRPATRRGDALAGT